MIRTALIAATVLAALPLGALAQIFPGGFGSARRPEPPCVLDKCLGLRPGPANNGGGQPSSRQPLPTSNGGAFDFYVLALSWSPSFCASGGADKSPDQCEPGANPGFVVHGLWPQNQHGYPEACDAGGTRSPSRMALDAARDVYPDLGLARHEWREHGTCSGKSPADYFADVRRARDAVAIPPELKAPHDEQTLAPLDIARSFVDANPRLRTDEMAVTCRRGELEEVRICFSPDLRTFVPCPEITRASCRRPMTVPSG